MRFLVDMDGVIVDFEEGFLKKWRAKYPNLPYIPLEERKTFDIEDQYPRELSDKVVSIYNAQGFFLNLNPIKNSLKAIEEMRREGEVFICTSPLIQNDDCVKEKYLWIRNHLGKDWMKKLIIIKDKTLVRCNYLIDDKPKIEGVEKPSWEHVIYDQPYNQKFNGKRITWKNWRTLLEK